MLHASNRLLIVSPTPDLAQLFLNSLPEFQSDRLIFNNKYYEAQVEVTIQTGSTHLTDYGAVIFLVQQSSDVDQLSKCLKEDMETRLCIIQNPSLQEEVEDYCLDHGIEPILWDICSLRRVIEALECHPWPSMTPKTQLSPNYTGTFKDSNDHFEDNEAMFQFLISHKNKAFHGP
jgi:hypothetical protein